jgi:NADPH-dependent 2,4-dienoyl-CoA reductase/sulfur reductase-like enzyme
LNAIPVRPEVVVVGAGPAGMAAACTLAESGVEVLVLDEQPAPGGQVYREVEKVHAERPEDLAALGTQYRVGLELVRRFRHSGAGYLPRTSVWEITAASEPELAIGTLRDGAAQMLYPRHIILATGAMERPTPFPGWTLPGVMTVGAAQTLLKTSGLIPAGRIVLAGTGPLLYLYASQLLATGTRPEAILDTRPATSMGALASLLPALAGQPGALLRGLGWMRAVRGSIPVLSRVTALKAQGDERVASVCYESAGQSHELKAELLLVHDGVIPNTWLAMAAGIQHHFDQRQACWVPDVRGVGRTSRESIAIVGDGAAIQGAEVAILQGERLAHEVLGQLRTPAGPVQSTPAEPTALRQQRLLQRFLKRYFPPTAYFQLPLDDSTIVCRCEEITAGEIRKVAALGCVGPNQAKAFTRCGMGPCMGRKCAATVSQLIAQVRGLPVAEVGHYRIRPPIRPLTVGQLADMSIAGEESGAPSGAGAVADLLTPGDQ